MKNAKINETAEFHLIKDSRYENIKVNNLAKLTYYINYQTLTVTTLLF